MRSSPSLSIASSAMSSVDRLGKYSLRWADYLFDMGLLLYFSFRSSWSLKSSSFRAQMSVIASQIYFTGYQALPLISVLAVATGSVLILQGQMNLRLVGGADVLGSFLIATLVREVSPLLTALVVVARSGTAVATEIGNMRANKEIDALYVMGINPYSYIVFPRIVGGVISVLALAFYFNLIGLVGGFAIVKLLSDVSSFFYFDTLLMSFSREDIVIFTLKNTFSGLIIFIVACYQGLSVERSPHEVPRATTQAVVHSILLVTVFNFFVTALFYAAKLKSLGVL